jgi:hypothetical protein
VGDENLWLEGHGISLPLGYGDVTIEVAESIRIDTDVAGGEWKGLFQYELRPTKESDVEITLERTALARAELVGLLSEAGLPGPDLQARLRQHCGQELELLSRLGSRLRGNLPDDALERLLATRELSIERFHNLLPGDKERMAVFGGEKWTTRKVLRCFAVVERTLLRDVRALVPAKISGQSPR